MEQTVNSFLKGLLNDTHPMILGNEVLSDALNATYVTANGNEVILQNDMGNRKIEEAFLPVGYVPIGIKEYGGIIYIASYNPITNRGQVGSFPSPERTNVYNSDELEIDFSFDTFEEKGFCFFKELTKIFVIYKDILHTGDKFTLFNTNELWINKEEYKEYLSNFDNIDETSHKILSPKNKQYTLSVGILDLNNNFIDITKELYRYKVTYNKDGNPLNTILAKNGYNLFDFNSGYFLAGKSEFGLEDIVESYRKIVSTPGTFYKLKLNSSLCIKVLHNYPSKFTYNISGEASEDKTEINNLTITAVLEYNCPDGGGLDLNNDSEIYYNLYTYSLYLCDWFNFYIKDDEDNYKMLYNVENEPSTVEICDGITDNSIDINVFHSYTLTKIDFIRLYTQLLEKLEKVKKELEKDLNSLEYANFMSSYYGLKKSYLGDRMKLLHDLDISNNYSEKIKYDKDSNKYICTISKTYLKNSDIELNIGCNRINDRGEHIIDYFIGVPYNLTESYSVMENNSCANCTNPYIRSLSTFGEINIDTLNSEVFRVILWKFFTTYIPNTKIYKTTVTYQFNTGNVFKPFDIEITNVYPDQLSIINVNVTTNGVQTFTIDNLELGEAYKVLFKRNGEILTTNKEYWIICTELFNNKDLTSSYDYIGNNYVDVPQTITINQTVYDTLKNQLKLLTVPLDVLLESTLEDEGVEVTRDSGTFDNDTIIRSDSQEIPTGTLTEKYTGTFDIAIGVSSAKIAELNNKLYPIYLINFVKNNNWKYNISKISKFSLGTPELCAGDLETMEENTKIPSSAYKFIESEFKAELEDSKLHIKGLINFDYVCKFRYHKLNSEKKTIVVQDYSNYKPWKTNDTGKLYSNYLNNLNSGKKYLAIKKSDNESYYIFNSKITSNNDVNSITSDGPSKYTMEETVDYAGDNKMYYVENNTKILVDYLKSNILEVLNTFKNGDNCNILKTNLENGSTQEVRYSYDNGPYYKVGDVNIIWIKALDNGKEVWVPIKNEQTHKKSGISTEKIMDAIIDSEKETILNEIKEKLKLPNLILEGLYIPTKIQDEKITKYVYGIFKYNSQSPVSTLDIILDLSYYDYGIWMKIPNNKFDINGLNFEGVEDNNLGIFKFNVNTTDTLETSLFEKFLGPILDTESYYSKVDNWETPDSGNYYAIFDDDNKLVIDGIQINMEDLNLGTYRSTGCVLKTKEVVNGETIYRHFVLNTGLIFQLIPQYDDKGNITTTKLWPVFNMNRKNDSIGKIKNQYMGTLISNSNNEGLRVGFTSTGRELDLSFKNNELITHLFSYDR